MLGRLIGGRYEVTRHIAGGGMATVYQGRDTILDRVVAIKVMDQQLGKNDEFIERFILEAKATGRLSHPNIVSVYDVGEEQGLYYMVMEFVEGVTLKDHIINNGYLTAKEAVEICSQICDGLAHAHNQGIIHRDIKPHNILCTPDGRYKLTDFGIARFVEAASHLTKTGTVMGSVHYFSPEQASGQKISFTSDIYSLGVVLFEMLTGTVPFDAKEHVHVAIMHLHDAVPDPRLVQEDLPTSLTEVLFQALAKQPEERIATAEELKQALQRALINSEPVKKRVTIPKTREERIKPQKTNKKKNILIGIGVVILLIMGYLFSTMGRPQADTPTNTNTTSQTPPAQVAESQPSNVTYVVVAGSFQSHSNAQKLMKKLINHNFNANIVRKEVDGKRLYRVYSGDFSDKSEADALLEKIKQSGIEGMEKAHVGEIS